MRSGKMATEATRQEDGATGTDYSELLSASGASLEGLRRVARERTPDLVTYSRNVTLAITRLCRNRCGYCGYRREEGEYLAWRDILPLLRKAEEAGCCEALFMTGERPEEVLEAARRWLKREGFSSTSEYVAWLCGRTMDETDLLPHTNIGVLTADELRELKGVNASMGLMLENSSERLCGAGMPHERSPGKDPARRLATIAEAGRLGIPFTTGVLVGIGETDLELLDTLHAIRTLNERHGHLQEVIIQRFIPRPSTPMSSHATAPRHRMQRIVAIARLVLGRDMNIQVPPNLEVDFEELLASGANDLGGISDLTRDQINPDMPWPAEHEIINRVSRLGLRSSPRPPVYPEFVKPKFLSPRLLKRSRDWLRRFEEESDQP